MTRATTRLAVKTLVEGWDMRGIHKLRKSKDARALRPGQCLLAFNKAYTIGRLIDHVGGIHTYYAPPKEIFDMAAISKLVAAGFHVSIVRAAAKKSRSDRLKAA